MKFYTYFCWALIFLFIVLITIASMNNKFGAPYARLLIEKFFPGISEKNVELLVFVSRKSIHIISYGVLAFLAYQAASGTRGLKRKPYLWSAIIALGVAIFDEGLQSLQDFRSGRIGDVIIDGIGIILTLYTIYRAKGGQESDIIREDMSDN